MQSVWRDIVAVKGRLEPVDTCASTLRGSPVKGHMCVSREYQHKVLVPFWRSAADHDLHQ